MISEMLLYEPLIGDYCHWLVSYAASATLLILVMLWRNTRKQKRFSQWKRDTINLGVFKREYEPNMDEFIQQLWEENEANKKELKKHKSRFTKVGWAAIAALFNLTKQYKGNKFLQRKFEFMNVEDVKIEGKQMTITFKRELQEIPRDEDSNLPSLN